MAAASKALPLQAGAVWKGCQTSGETCSDVEVRICAVDDRGDVSGTLTIRNLTPTLPKLVTYFDGEIVGDHHSLVTGKWGATPEDDRRLWNRFKKDLSLPGVDSLDDKAVKQYDNIVFMRLKERSIVGATHDSDVSGASFAGFYYIAVDLKAAPAQSDLFSVKSAGPPSPVVTDPRPLSPPAWGRASLPPSVRSPPASTPTIGRMSSYASAVRGRTPGPVFAGSPTSSPIDIPADSSGNGAKAEDTFDVSVASVRSAHGASDADGALDMNSLGLSLEEFPLPTSPIRQNGFPFQARPGAAKRSNSEAGVRTSTHFTNARTGYRGPFAQATMKGFYFACEGDPFQEIELHYVGTGLGLALEEYAEPVGGIDEWGNPKFIDEKRVLSREFAIRERLARPQASASFTFL